MNETDVIDIILGAIVLFIGYRFMKFKDLPLSLFQKSTIIISVTLCVITIIISIFTIYTRN
jgi:hypothetical protein